MSSASNFAFDDRPSARSFVYIKNSSGPSMDPWGIPALTSFQEEVVHWELLSAVYFLRNLITDLKGYQICHSVSVWK